jgi:hypothetical protein
MRTLKSLAAFSSTSSAARPLPKYQTGSGAARRWNPQTTTVAPALNATAALERRSDHGRAGRLGQRRQLGQRSVDRPSGVAGGVEADEEGALVGGGEIDHAVVFGHPFTWYPIPHRAPAAASGRYEGHAAHASRTCHT